MISTMQGVNVAEVFQKINGIKYLTHMKCQKTTFKSWKLKESNSLPGYLVILFGYILYY